MRTSRQGEPATYCHAARTGFGFERERCSCPLEGHYASSGDLYEDPFQVVHILAQLCQVSFSCTEIGHIRLQYLDYSGRFGLLVVDGDQRLILSQFRVHERVPKKGKRPSLDGWTRRGFG